MNKRLIKTLVICLSALIWCTSILAVPARKNISHRAPTVGSTVKFGRYWTDVFSDKKAPIEWIVLAENQGRYLLISKYGLDAKLYHDDYVSTTWDSCTLRTWLNREFMNAAFTKKEKDKIITVLNQTLNNPDTGPYGGTYGGKPTKDSVFLLSVEEARYYFKDKSSRQCRATKYAIQHDVYTNNGYCTWWLRTPGGRSALNVTYSSRVTYVDVDGRIDVQGSMVSGKSTIRPALWVTNL